MNLKPCPFCGGEIDERGGQCNYGKKTMLLGLRCKECGTIFKFKIKWEDNPYREAVEAWNKRTTDEELEFTREFIIEKGLLNELLNKWKTRKVERVV